MVTRSKQSPRKSRKPLSRGKKILKRSLVTLGLTLTGVFVLNGVIVHLSKPVTVNPGATVKAIDSGVGDIELHAYEELESGGLPFFGLSKPVVEYVDMLSPETIIYLRGKSTEGQRYSQLYQHELAHVLQKEMVAEASGGYPSVWNPWRSGVYYSNLIKLNAALEETMPETVSEGTTLFSRGLEASAECYSQPVSSLDEDPVYYEAPYLKTGFCTATEKRNAIKLVSTDRWYEPLSSVEAASLAPVNITTEVPLLDFEFKVLTKSINEIKKKIEKTLDSPVK